MTEENKCEHCSEHQVNSMKILQTCNRVEKLELKYEAVKDMIEGKDGVYIKMSVIEQKLEAFKYPLYIIASAALLNIAKTLFSFSAIGGVVASVTGVK